MEVSSYMCPDICNDKDDCSTLDKHKMDSAHQFQHPMMKFEMEKISVFSGSKH